MKKTKPFATEAALCAAFIAWVSKTCPEVRCYAEWAGWDILLVYPQGYQLGIQAKLRLNADVIAQAAPQYDFEAIGPDYRGVLVPGWNAMAAVADRCGLIVFRHYYRYREADDFGPHLTSHRESDTRFCDRDEPPSGWLDWNPKERHDLPPTVTDAVAGSPCPVSLTPWKLGALDVLAHLAVHGAITTKRIRELGVNPSRWTECRWLEPGDQRGVWVRGEKCPGFDKQHPTAYAHALENAKTKPAEEAATA